MTHNIDPELLKDIQVTGITEADYARATKHIEAIKTVESLFFQCFFIYDYYKMEFYFISSHAMDFLKTHNLLNIDNKNDYFGLLDNDTTFKLIKENQNFIKKLPPEERNNFVFAYNFLIKLKDTKTMINFKTKILETAPDGRIWLELSILTLFPCKEVKKLIAHHSITGNTMEFDLAINQWVKTNKIYLTDLERAILRLSAQGKTIKEISELTYRTQSTIDTHRKNIFKKMQVHNVTEAIGYASLLRLL